MKTDFTKLDQAVADLTAEAAATETTDASVEVVLKGFSDQIAKAVEDALTADAAANQASIDAANAAIATVTGRFVKARTDLGAAIPPPAAA